MDKRSAPMEPILRDIPESFESERLKIRPPRQGDGQLVFDDVRESLADLRRFSCLDALGACRAVNGVIGKILSRGIFEFSRPT